MNIYNITDSQMRAIWIFQIISLFILWGFLVLPIVIIYYLGWKNHNKKDEKVKFLDFLFDRSLGHDEKKLNTEEVRELENKIHKGIKSTLGMSIALFLLWVILPVGVLFYLFNELRESPYLAWFISIMFLPSVIYAIAYIASTRHLRNQKDISKETYKYIRRLYLVTVVFILISIAGFAFSSAISAGSETTGGLGLGFLILLVIASSLGKTKRSIKRYLRHT